MKSRRIKKVIATLMVAATAVSANSMVISASAAEGAEQGITSEQEGFKIEFPENVSVCYADDWGMPKVDPSNVNPNKRIVIASNDFFAITKNDEVGTPYNENHYKSELNWKDPKTHEQIRPYVWRGYLTEDAKIVCPGIKPNDYFRIGETSTTKDHEYALAANGSSMYLDENEVLKVTSNGKYNMGRTYDILQSENGIGIYLVSGIGTEADPYVFGENVIYKSDAEFEGNPDALHSGDVILSGAELTFNEGWSWNMWISNYAYNIQQDYNSADGDSIKVYLNEERNCNYCAVQRNGETEYEEGLPGGNAVVFDDAVNGYHFSQCYYDSETGKITVCKEEAPEETTEPETPEEDNKLDVKFSGHTVSLEGDIALNFFTEINEELSDDAYMHFVQEGKAVDIKVNDAKIVNDKENNKEYHVFKCKVNAKDMTAGIAAQIIDGDKTSEVTVYSIRAYADKMFENEEKYEKAVPLVKAMLNYGTYAQLFFGSNNPLANEGLDDTGLDDVTLESMGERPIEKNLPEGVTFSGATLTATSDTVVSLFFKSDKELKFTYNGQELETETINGYQKCNITGIKAMNLDRYHTISVSDGTAEGTIRYNPMTYCISTVQTIENEISKGTLSEEEIEQYRKQADVAKSLFKYSEAAKEYFAKR